MIQDSDEDILNNDFIKWSVEIKKSFEDQLIEAIQKRELDDNFDLTPMNGGLMQQMRYPFMTRLYVQYRTRLSDLYVPLDVPIEVAVLSDSIDDAKHSVDSAFDILMNMLRTGIEVVGNPENSKDYHHYFPVAGHPAKPGSERFEQLLRKREREQLLSITYFIKNMKTNPFLEMYRGT